MSTRRATAFVLRLFVVCGRVVLVGTAVLDDQHGPAGRAARDLQRRCADAGSHRLVALAVVPSVQPVLPAREALGEASLYLGVREAGPFSDVDLAQALVDPHRQSM